MHTTGVARSALAQEETPDLLSSSLPPALNDFIVSKRVFALLGIGKAGTTSTYVSLASTGLFRIITDTKENCGRINYWKRVGGIVDDGGKHSLFECHFWDYLLLGNEEYSVDVLPVVLVRDYRDWLYSSFMFWCV